MLNNTLTIVTGNTKKYAEMEEALSHHGITTQRHEADIEEIQSADVREIITDKVAKAFTLVDGPVLVDDSGIYFEQYDNFPGFYSKYLFHSLGYDGIFRLVQPGDKAWFHCFVAYYDAQLSEPQIFDAKYYGTIVEPNSRDESNPMPYAPMFVPAEITDGRRMAEMTFEERKHDHRHTALNAFAQWFTERNDS